MPDQTIAYPPGPARDLAVPGSYLWIDNEAAPEGAVRSHLLNAEALHRVSKGYEIAAWRRGN